LLPQRGAKGTKEDMKTQRDIFRVCDQVRETAFALHRYLRHGHLEKVYENGLAHRLRKLGTHVEQQHKLEVLDEDGILLGDYSADLLVDGELLVELKACRALNDEHVAQVLGYLRGCRMEHGLLINFGSSKLEVRKYIMSDVS
jgi:GxxExxY protein